MPIHFEELWEKCENLHQNEGSTEPVHVIVDDLAMKINLYKLVDGRTDVPEEERQKAKSRTMGEILLTLTHLSLKDNINVFEALNVAQQHRSAPKTPKIKLPNRL